jgi:predicted PurR-regulated permease PerM
VTTRAGATRAIKADWQHRPEVKADHSVRSISDDSDLSVDSRARGVESPRSRVAILRALTIGVWILAGLSVVFTLQWARALLVPVVCGVLASYVLEPIVMFLVVRGVARYVAAPIVVLAVIASLGASIYALHNQASALVAKLPRAAIELREALQQRRAQPSAMAQVQRAADELHQIAAQPSPPAQAQAIRKVQIEPKPFDLADYLWSTSASAVGFIGDAIVVVFLALYLLMAGDSFRRRAIEFAGPTLTRKKITLQILNDISRQVSAYLLIRTVISAIVALLTGVALWALGLAQPAIWGLDAGILNFAPYIGSFVAACAIGTAAFLQFHTLTLAGSAVAATVLVACIEAYVITPWLTSRSAAMNPVAVFIGLVFWGWLWGVPGLLLAVPLMMILKAVGEHVESVRPAVGFLLAADEPRIAEGP